MMAGIVIILVLVVVLISVMIFLAKGRNRVSSFELTKEGLRIRFYKNLKN